MQLHDLLKDVAVLGLSGDMGVDIETVEHDSRRVAPGALFCAIRGNNIDGHLYAQDAVERGAVAILNEHVLDLHVPQVQVADVRQAIGPLSCVLSGHPSRKMCVVGITGTNGKTTVAFMLDAIGRAAGELSGTIGTLGARIDDETLELAFTTPEASELQRLLADMVNRNVRMVAMEVSSHALEMHRVDGTRFAAACFTNLTQDHLDFHGTTENYFEAKAKLFTSEFTDRAVISCDDPMGDHLASRSEALGLTVSRFGFDSRGDVRAETVEATGEGSRFRLIGPGESREVFLPLPGRFNVSNALAAAASALAVGRTFDSVVAGLEQIGNIPGRMEPVVAGQSFGVIVDFAHTPDALGRVLIEARAMAIGRRVIVVFGCGGDRDRDKRAAMGRAAAGADLVVLTSDNPRSEDPSAIASASVEGLVMESAEFLVILDRREAIRTALCAAKEGDVVVIAGKGHERVQTAGDHVDPFDDHAVALEELEALV